MKLSRFVVAIFASAFFLLAFAPAFVPLRAQQRTESDRPNYFENDNSDAMYKWLRDYENPEHAPDFEQKRYDGIQQLRHMSNRAALKANGSTAWIEAGISQTGDVSGRPLGMDIGPDGTIFLGAASGGLWRSYDRGAHWTCVSDGKMGTMCVSAVGVDPTNAQVIYAATGEPAAGLDPTYQGNSPIPGIGIYKSVDGGNNWQMLANTSQIGAYISHVIVNPSNPNMVYASGGTVWRSTNAGTTWVKTLTALNVGHDLSMVLNPVNHAILYSGAGSSLYKSVDSGATWTALPKGFPVANAGLMTLAMTPADPNFIYVASAVSSNRAPWHVIGAIGYSSDGGTDWQISLDTANCPGDFVTQGDYAVAIAIDPKNASNIIFGGLNVYASGQNGSNPSEVANSNASSQSGPNYTHADIHWLHWYGDSVFCLSDGGIFHSEDNGQSWKQNMNTNLNTLQLVGGDAYFPNSIPKSFIGGAQDNGTTNWTTSSLTPTTGPIVHGGDGGRCFIDQSNGQTIYASYPNYLPPSAAIYKGIPGNDLEFSPNYLFQTAIYTDATHYDLPSGYMFYEPCESDFNTVVLCGGTKGYISTDGLASVLAMSNKALNPTTGATVTMTSPSYIHVAKIDPYQIYYGGSGGTIYTSTDQGTDWTQMKTKTLNGRILWITTDPTDETSVYAVTYNSTGKPLWHSSDAGATWSQPTMVWNQPTKDSLPPGVYRTVAVDAQGDIFLGHDGGVIAMDHRDSTWTPLTNGMPAALVSALQVRGGHYLVATTYGRGMYYIDINSVFANSSVASAPQASAIAIESVYPNPVASSAAKSTVQYTLQGAAEARLAIYDNLGREERVIANAWTGQGEHETQCDLTGLPSGQHYIMLTAAGTTVTKAITIE